jgi:hypothetical protein
MEQLNIFVDHQKDTSIIRKAGTHETARSAKQQQ